MRTPSAEQELFFEGDPRRVDSVMQERIARLERLSTLLDSAFEVPGTGFRIGWDTIVGLIPGVGDLTTAAVSTYILQQAHQLCVSRFTLMRMTANVVVDALVGAVPLVGDIFDATSKANQKNMKLLRKSLKRRGYVHEQPPTMLNSAECPSSAS